MSRDNERWIAELRAGDSAALTDLRQALLANLRKAMARQVRSDEAFLEDCVQDALLRIVDRLDRFAGRSQFVTWSTSVAIRVAFGELRRRRWNDVSLDSLDVNAGDRFAGVADADVAPDRWAEQRDLLNALRLAIENDLTDRQRTALLAELKGMPQDEITRQLGSNRNALYKLTHDARKKLKKVLIAAGFSAGDAVNLVN